MWRVLPASSRGVAGSLSQGWYGALVPFPIFAASSAHSSTNWVAFPPVGAFLVLVLFRVYDWFISGSSDCDVGHQQYVLESAPAVLEGVAGGFPIKDALLWTSGPC